MESALTAERYSHGVRLSGYSKETLYKMQRFLDTLLLREPTKVQGRMVMVTKKKYYGMTEDGTSIFLHRNSYPQLVAYLENVGITSEKINVIDIPVPKAEPATFVVQSKFTARPIARPTAHSRCGQSARGAEWMNTTPRA